MIEHINAEIVLGTITNLQTAIKWLKSTFLYIRLKKNPSYYSIKVDRSNSARIDVIIDNYLIDLCKENLNELMLTSLIEKSSFVGNSDVRLLPTANGRLMANYCLMFKTMKSFIVELNNKFASKSKSMDETKDEEGAGLDELDLFQPKKSLRDLVSKLELVKLFQLTGYSNISLLRFF